MEIKVWPYLAELEVDYWSLTVKAIEWKKNLYYDICPTREILNQNVKMIEENIRKMFFKRINTKKSKVPKPKRDWSIPMRIWF